MNNIMSSLEGTVLIKPHDLLRANVIMNVLYKYCI